VFILYAVPLGLIVGWLLGGRVARLEEVRLRWASLAMGGLLVQLALFSGPVAERIGSAGTPIYVGSTAVVLAALLRNLRIPGLALVAVGAVSNLAAILANDGSMPASPGALAALGKSIGSEYSNSVLGTDPALAPLTDVFAMPRWMPMANVFSIGDVLIGLGIAIAIALAMRGGASGNLPPKYPRPGTHEPWPAEAADHTVTEKATSAFR
jgi:hypothetical protein